MKLRILVAGATLSLLSGMAIAESGFLSDYSKLKPVRSSTGEELVYVAPGAYERAVGYTSVMVDQPEILFSAHSEYRGMKPEDIVELASIMRSVAKERLEERGRYKVVEQPGPDVLFVRMALTELYLKKKKRGALGYTPIGAVVKVGTDRLKETLEKIDIIEMTFEAELVDSMSKDVLAAIVVPSGARKAKEQTEQRMDMAAFRAHIHEFASRLSCQLDNAKLPESGRIDCTDPKAREARESTAE